MFCLNSVNFIGVFLISVIIAYFIYMKCKKNYTFVFICLSIMYFMFFVCITIFPITILSKNELNELHSRVGQYIKYYQFIPFKTIMGVGTYNFFRQVICNIILFFPLPFIIKVLIPKTSGLKVIVSGMLCSLFVEMIQLLIDIITRYPSHICDIDDFILNSMGVIIGYFVYIVINKITVTNKLFKRFVYKRGEIPQ